MIENFIEYMWYLLTTPLKKLKKALNKWYILCRVFGKRFDEAKEDILRARDEGMVATCSHEMLRYMELIEGSPGMKENIQRTSAQG